MSSLFLARAHLSTTTLHGLLATNALRHAHQGRLDIALLEGLEVVIYGSDLEEPFWTHACYSSNVLL